MNKTIYIIGAFVTGVGLGAAATWRFFDQKYKTIADEEIASVKEMYAQKLIGKQESVEKIEDVPELVKKEFHIPEKPDIFEYASKLKDQGYDNYANPETIEKEKKEKDFEDKLQKGGSSDMTDKPYVISPSEFNEMDDYETSSLTYYADDVLTDDADNIISNPDKLIGDLDDVVSHFGEYEDDSVFVRNDDKKIDYEVLRDLRTYSETHSGD